VELSGLSTREVKGGPVSREGRGEQERWSGFNRLLGKESKERRTEGEGDSRKKSGRGKVDGGQRGYRR